LGGHGRNSGGDRRSLRRLLGLGSSSHRRGLDAHVDLLTIGEDVGDAHDRQVLAMTLLALRILATALEEGDHLRTTGLLDDRAGHGGALDGGRADDGLLAADQQNILKGDSVAGFGVELLHGDDVVAGNLVLLPARLDHCEHRVSLVFGRASVETGPAS
jgi:hypothetical protein